MYVFCLVSLLGEQWTEEDEVDLYYPIFITIKFLFYFGWLRVAETLYNPFGEDDDDFELNELLNRHFRVGLSIVEEREPPPSLERDMFWDRPAELGGVGSGLQGDPLQHNMAEARDPML